MSSAALASLKAVVAECNAHAAGFGRHEAAAGLLAADELRALFLPLARTRGNAALAGVPPPAALQAVAADQAPLTLLQLPAEVLVLVLCRLDALSLARIAATCLELYHDKPRPMTPVEEALRQRAASRGRVCPAILPQEFSSWAAYLAWIERRRDDEAWAPVAACLTYSLFVAEGGRLMSCGKEKAPGVLGLGELDGKDRVATTPTLLPSMAGVRISSVSGGSEFNAAVSAAGTVYTWGDGRNGSLGHGDLERSLIPKQVQALAGHRVLSTCAGQGHCLAVTERGKVFSWGWDITGQCGHGSSRGQQLLPRLVEALAGVRVRSASAGAAHSLVVTEEGALYSFGGCGSGQLGNGSKDAEHSPKLVDALRHFRIATAAAGDYHSLALTDDGTVFSWGSNSQGQLGLQRSQDWVPLPKRVEALSGIKVRSLAAGGRVSCSVTAAGELYTWGLGRAGRLGHGDTADEHAPRRVEALQGEWVVAVSAGSEQTVAVTRGGSVFGWGSAGELGLPGNAEVDEDDFANEDDVCIMYPCRYPQLVCVRSQ